MSIQDQVDALDRRTDAQLVLLSDVSPFCQMLTTLRVIEACSRMMIHSDTIPHARSRSA